MKATASLRALHAFVRAPHYRSIPPTGPSGIIVNRDVLNRQFRDFYRTLQHSTLVDKVHLMSERPSIEALRVADQMTSIGPMLLGMPLTGMEHRASEFAETMRYVRTAGGPTNVSPYLQDNDACRCHSGDIVVLPQGIAVGHGPRTNAATHQMLRDVFCSGADAAEAGSVGSSAFEVVTLEQEGDAPPLGDYFGFAGNNLLLVWKDEHGLLAVDQLQQHLAKSGTAQQQPPLKVVYLEPGCHFFTFYGVDMSTDVLVQKGFARSMDALAAEGLNPIAVQWSEMDKLGISMRAAVLPLKFFLSPSSTGGMLQRSRNRVGRWRSSQLVALMDITPSSSRALRQRLWRLFTTHSTLCCSPSNADSLAEGRRLGKKGFHACLDSLSRPSTFRGLFIGSEEDDAICEAAAQLQTFATQDALWMAAVEHESAKATTGPRSVATPAVPSPWASNDAFADADFYGAACYQGAARAAGSGGGGSPVASGDEARTLIGRAATIAWTTFHTVVVLYLVDTHGFVHSFLAGEVAALRCGGGEGGSNASTAAVVGVGTAPDLTARVRRTARTTKVAPAAASTAQLSPKPSTPTRQRHVSTPQSPSTPPPALLRSPAPPLSVRGAAAAAEREREDRHRRPPASPRPTGLFTHSPLRGAACPAAVVTPPRLGTPRLLPLPPSPSQSVSSPLSRRETEASALSHSPPPPLLTARSTVDESGAEVGKPAPPPLRKHTQREAAEQAWQQRHPATAAQLSVLTGGSAQQPPQGVYVAHNVQLTIKAVVHCPSVSVSATSSSSSTSSPSPSAVGVAPQPAPSAPTPTAAADVPRRGAAVGEEPSPRAGGLSSSPPPRRPESDDTAAAPPALQPEAARPLHATAPLRQRSSSEMNAAQPQLTVKGHAGNTSNTKAEEACSKSTAATAAGRKEVRRPRLACASGRAHGQRRVYTTRRPQGDHTAVDAPAAHRGSCLPLCGLQRPALAEAWPGRRPHEPSLELEPPPTTRNDDGFGSRQHSPSPLPCVPAHEEGENGGGRRSRTVEHAVEGRRTTTAVVLVQALERREDSRPVDAPAVRYASPEKPSRASRSPPGEDLWAATAQPPTQTSRRRLVLRVPPTPQQPQQPSPFSTAREPFNPVSHYPSPAVAGDVRWRPHAVSAPSPTPTPRDDMDGSVARSCTTPHASVSRARAAPDPPEFVPPPPPPQPQQSPVVAVSQPIGVPRILSSAFTSPLVSARASVGSASRRRSAASSSSQPQESMSLRGRPSPQHQRQPSPVVAPATTGLLLHPPPSVREAAESDAGTPPQHSSPDTLQKAWPAVLSPPLQSPSSVMRQRRTHASVTTPTRRPQPASSTTEVTTPPPRLSHRARVRSSSRGGRAVPTPPRVPQTRMQLSPSGSLQATPRRLVLSPTGFL